MNIRQIIKSKGNIEFDGPTEMGLLGGFFAYKHKETSLKSRPRRLAKHGLLSGGFFNPEVNPNCI